MSVAGVGDANGALSEVHDRVRSKARPGRPSPVNRDSIHSRASGDCARRQPRVAAVSQLWVCFVEHRSADPGAPPTRTGAYRDRGRVAAGPARRLQEDDCDATDRGGRLHRISRRHHASSSPVMTACLAAASSSRMAWAVPAPDSPRRVRPVRGIESASVPPGMTLLEVFDARVWGYYFRHGKPDPEMLHTAEPKLGVAPEAAVVLEDAAAGVQAAKACWMGAIGISRRRRRPGRGGRRRHRRHEPR